MGLGRALASPFTDTYKSYASPFQGGFRPHIGGAIAGAGAGAMLGGMIPYGMDSGQSALIGAGAGALALPTLGALGALSIKAMENPGMLLKGARGVGMAVAAPVALTGYGIGKGLSTLGGITHAAGAANLGADMSLFGKGLDMHKKMVAQGAVNTGKELIRQNPITRHGNLVGNALGGVLKYTPERSYFDESKGKVVTKRGKMGLSKSGLVAGSAIGLGVMAKGFVDDLYESRAGTPTGVSRATPNYLDNAGATGDLVFAMHQNRRG